MLKFIALLSLVTGALAGSVSVSNLPRLDGRIVGGQETTIEEYPYQVAVEYNGYHFCGGSIINERHVLTAAHCMEDRSVADYKVRAGTTTRNSGGTVYDVFSVARHSRYDGATYDNDIAVIRIVDSFTYGTTMQPVQLAPAGYIPSEAELTVVTGWGTTREGGSLPEKLQFVEVPIVTNAKCNDSYLPAYAITDAMLCAGFEEGGRDACQGDSGGPLVLNGVEVGVVSWGYGCARPNIPGVYASVGYFRNWIDGNVIV